MTSNLFSDGQRIFWLSYGEYRGKREIKPFLRYVEARIDENNREEAYRLFISESVRLAPQGKYITKSYSDIFEQRQIETRSGDEIAMDVITNAGLIFGE